jgi:hypothetical protein
MNAALISFGYHENELSKLLTFQCRLYINTQKVKEFHGEKKATTPTRIKRKIILTEREIRN